ncbi:MAG: hypothetical protein VB061_08320 [Christensenella sp.]|nr:hypothetical protein [Christensenella sp.]
MKLERNRAERRSKHGVPILYNGVPYLIFAALAAGFLLGAPQQAATSAITQSDKSTVSVVERKQLPFALAGYLGKTNSALSRGFTEEDFTFTGSKTWVDDGDGNFRLKFLSSGTFTPKKKIKIDIFLVGGGGGGRNGVRGSNQGGGGAGGYTGTWTNFALYANQSYTITIGAGGSANGGTGGTTSISGYGITTMSKSGGTPNASYFYFGGNGGSGAGGSNACNGGSDGSNGIGTNAGTGQGTTTKEFGETGGTLYAGGGGGGGFNNGGSSGGAGGGGNGGGSTYSSSAYNGTAGTNNLGGGGGGGGANSSNAASGAAGGSGIAVIRNAR